MWLSVQMVKTFVWHSQINGTATAVKLCSLILWLLKETSNFKHFDVVFDCLIPFHTPWAKLITLEPRPVFKCFELSDLKVWWGLAIWIQGCPVRIQVLRMRLVGWWRGWRKIQPKWISTFSRLVPRSSYCCSYYIFYSNREEFQGRGFNNPQCLQVQSEQLFSWPEDVVHLLQQG